MAGRIAQYLDGDLEPAWRERVASHLESCRHCGRELILQEKAWRALDAFPGREPSPGFVKSVGEMVRGERTPAKRPVPFQFPFLRPAWALVSLLVVAAILLALVLRPVHREVPAGSVSHDLLSMGTLLEEREIAESAFKIKLEGNIGEIRGVFADESGELLDIFFE
jgi:anti-sigma factor RsiW